MSKRELARKAAHDDKAHAWDVRTADPFVKSVAYGICSCVYSGRCACGSQREKPACSTMISAAMHAIGLVERRS